MYSLTHILNAWFPGSGTNLGGSRNLTGWGLAGGNRSMGSDFVGYT